MYEVAVAKENIQTLLRCIAFCIEFCKELRNGPKTIWPYSIKIKPLRLSVIFCHGTHETVELFEIIFIAKPPPQKNIKKFCIKLLMFCYRSVCGRTCFTPHPHSTEKRQKAFWRLRRAEDRSELALAVHKMLRILYLTWWTRPSVSPVLYTGQWLSGIKLFILNLNDPGSNFIRSFQFEKERIEKGRNRTHLRIMSQPLT
ncbi:hypothetical protein GQR58_029066 [Nymphon striatum]|nr:hypothetical protein GQR58_029066 [Nymphon striatum]